MESTTSSRFGKYLLLERIGVGGMAEVFKAKTFGAEGFERLVAIKRILPHLVEDDDFVKMFIDEAKIAVRLNHPNIVGIQDLGKAEGTLYIAMEFVQGRDLRAIYDYENEHEGHPPIGLACHVVMKMCEALHHAHFATGPRGEPLQVIHRDVSPQNVLISYDGEVKVADFGLAKARGRMVQTQAGVVKGKLAYMSPEQLRGDDIDHRVDVFGLGIVLFELLTSERLFLGPSDMDTLRRVYEARVPPLTELNPEVHPELEAIVRKALEKDRDARYQTALELHDDLQSFVYAHGCYAGASTLRTYLREAFPEAAPPAPVVPAFAPASPPTPRPPPPPTLEPRPTHRPPRLREEIPPPAQLAPPPMPSLAPGAVFEVDDRGADPADPFSEPTVNHDAYDLDAAIDAALDSDQELPTDRPPPFDELERELSTADEDDDTGPTPAVLTRAVVSTGRPPPPSAAEGPSVPESSGTVSSGTADRNAFPTQPPGLYEDEAPTHHPEAARGPDTSPAPAPDGELPSFVSDGWDEDDQTVMVPGGLDALREKAAAAAAAEAERDWDDDDADSTIIVDPRAGTRGRR